MIGSTRYVSRSEWGKKKNQRKLEKTSHFVEASSLFSLFLSPATKTVESNRFRSIPTANHRPRWSVTFFEAFGGSTLLPLPSSKFSFAVRCSLPQPSKPRSGTSSVHAVMTLAGSLTEKKRVDTYDPTAFDMDGFHGSLVEYMVKGTEKLHAKVGRFKSPDEHPFFPDDLPEPMLPPLQYPKCLSKRIHYGKFVAEAKFQASPEAYEFSIKAQVFIHFPTQSL